MESDLEHGRQENALACVGNHRLFPSLVLEKHQHGTAESLPWRGRTVGLQWEFQFWWMLHPNLIGHPTSVMTTGLPQPRTAVLPISLNVLYCLFAVTPRGLPSWRTAIQSIAQSWFLLPRCVHDTRTRNNVTLPFSGGSHKNEIPSVHNSSADSPSSMGEHRGVDFWRFGRLALTPSPGAYKEEWSRTPALFLIAQRAFVSLRVFFCSRLFLFLNGNTKSR